MIIVVIAFCLAVTACHKKVLRTSAITDRSAMPALEAKHVTTLISDSGIVRYRIKAEQWQIFDQAQPPYWEFDKGIYLERFDQDLNIDAWLQADYAYYDEQDQVWHLIGNVHAKNLAGEEFDTPEIYWNQKTEKVYNDTTIVITRETSIIRGVGFDSNQSLTKYTIRKPTGIIPIRDE